jgi:hypothetical protein
MGIVIVPPLSIFLAAVAYTFAIIAAASYLFLLISPP